MTTSLHLPTRPLTSVWCTLNGQRVHARVASAASPLLTPIVLVHGLSVSSRYMVPTAKRLAPFRQVFAPDLPGFGRSDKPQHILSVPELADTLIGWMDMYGIAQATLLGNSMGCQIIADIALRYPNRLDRAIFVGPTMDRAARTMPQQALRLAHDALSVVRGPLLTLGLMMVLGRVVPILLLWRMAERLDYAETVPG